MLIAGIVSSYSIDVWSATPFSTSENTWDIDRNHFIILIRDTKSMKDKFYPSKMVADTLPTLLFEGFSDDSNSLSKYRPQQDHLSVMFFSFHKDEEPVTECKSSPGLSFLPDYLFQWQPIEQGLTKQDFMKNIKTWMEKSCRATGYLASTVLAETMVLPYLQNSQAGPNLPKLPKDLLFSKTILVFVSNEAYYGPILPSEEIDAINQRVREEQKKQGKPVTGIQELLVATSSMEAFSRTFYFNSPSSWLWTIHPATKQPEKGTQDHGNTLKYRVAELQLLNPSADEFLDYPNKVQLDRKAISSDTLQVIQTNGEEDIRLRLRPSDRFRPVKLQLEFTDYLNTGKPWQIGSQTFPLSMTIDLKETELHKDDNGAILIPLLKTALKASPVLTAHDPLLTGGLIRFRLRFLYHSGTVNGQAVYDHHYVDTDWRTIEVTPVDIETIPSRQFLLLLNFSEITFDNQTLLAQYDHRQDSLGLTQTIARTRIEASRHSQQQQMLSLIIMVVIVCLIILMVLCYFFFYDRRFQPRLGWKAADNVAINFNEQPGATLLLGTFTVFNEGTVPWFGRLMLNKKYPDHRVELFVDYHPNQLEAQGFILEADHTPLGFMGVGTEPKLIRQYTEYRVSHQTPIYLFLATEVIKDFRTTDRLNDSVTVSLKNLATPIKVTLLENTQTAISHAEFDLQLLLETPKPPQVTYTPHSARLKFKQGQRLVVGTFILHSQAKHICAKPFTDNFFILARQNNLPLPEEAITLENQQVTVLPGQDLTIQVRLYCDGINIPNPNPPSTDYVFELRGNMSSDSDRGPYKLTLYRDSTCADLHLDILQFRKKHRLHWPSTGNTFGPPTCQLIVEDNVADTSDRLSDNKLALDSLLVKFDENKPAATLFEIQVGNTGTSGRGWVKAILNLSPNFIPSATTSITYYSGHHLEDILYLVTPTGQGIFNGAPEFLVKEGESPKKWIIQIHPAKIIRDIEGGRIDENQGTLTATLDLEIVTDQMFDPQGKLIGTPRRHQLTLTAGIGLEKLPHPNWLAIDFGTAAITAAIGKDKNIYLLPLQKIVPTGEDKNFKDYDPGNLESDTNLLPSYVVCDADLPAATGGLRTGYPIHRPISLIPGDPNFIGLPATDANLREYPDRIIYSLKSWLAQPSEQIVLQTPIEFEEQGRRVQRHDLPLTELVQSGLAALASAYITACPEFAKGGQLVLSHPNTFTEFHQNKLREIAYRALSGPLGIALPKERIRLLSESDAVAYHHCWQRRIQGLSKTGPELLLVYDFGAGTLDLSLIHIQWSPEGYPDQWQVENRLGVPIAGNHLDSLLARLIHQRLETLPQDFQGLIEYQYPPVARQLKGASEEDEQRHNHRQAVRALWKAIREAKQGTQDKASWDGNTPFYVKIGKLGEIGTVSVKSGANLPPYSNTEQPPLGEDSKGDIYLCIPANDVHNYRPLQDFIQFMTKEVITELLDGAGRTAAEVNTVVVSGRGALWAQASNFGIRQQVLEQFPHAEKPDLSQAQAVKSAVVRGAIAWQQLSREFAPLEPKRVPQLAILREPDKLTLESEWSKGSDLKRIDLKGTDTFWLVQVSLKNPNPVTDLKSLRRYFYIRLAKMRRDWGEWNQDPYLYVRKEPDDQRVRLQNSKGQGFDFPFGIVGQQAPFPPPWPIGQILLTPEEE